MNKLFVYVVKFIRIEEDGDTETTVALVTTEQNEIDEAILNLKKDLDKDDMNDWIFVHNEKLFFGRKWVLFKSAYGKSKVIIEVDTEFISIDTVKTLSRHI